VFRLAEKTMTRRWPIFIAVALVGTASSRQIALAGEGDFQLVPAAPSCPQGPDDISKYLDHVKIAFSPPPVGRMVLDLAPGSRLRVYAGHGYEEAGHTWLCTSPPRTARDLVNHVPAKNRLLAILNACYSAYVDLRGIAGDAAVISASDGPVSPEAGFGEAVETALRDLPNTDRNCDGIVTDWEIFQRITGILNSRLPTTRNEARPHLSSQSHTPIPIARVSATRPECGGQSEVVGRARALGGDLADAIEAQRRLTTGPGQTEALERFFRITGDLAERAQDDPAAEELRSALRHAGLKEIPRVLSEGDLLLVARHLFAAEIYEIDWAGDWLKVERLGERRLVTRQVRQGKLREAVESALPSLGPMVLREERIAQGGGTRLLVRFRGRAPDSIQLANRVIRENSLRLTPCPSPTGQCFWVVVDEALERPQ